MVEDIEQAIEYLKGVGVSMEHYDLPGLKTDERGIVELEGERSAWFTDPEGNIIAVMQPSLESALRERQRAHAAGV